MSKKLIFRTSLIGIFLFMVALFHQPVPIHAGKKSLLMGIALGAALKSRYNLDHVQLLHVWIPLKMVAEAWKHYGKHAAYQEHAYGGNYHHDSFGFPGLGTGGAFFKRRRR